MNCSLFTPRVAQTIIGITHPSVFIAVIVEHPFGPCLYRLATLRQRKAAAYNG